MPSTYDKIAAYTAPSSVTSYTFSSIPSTYTDLVIVASGVGTGDIDVSARFNGDSGANYSRTMLGGYAGSAMSSRGSGLTFFRLSWVAYWEASGRSNSIAHVMNYSNTTTHKTVLTRGNNANQGVDTQVALWRNTAAITSIEIFTSAFAFATGSTFTLYGIKAA